MEGNPHHFWIETILLIISIKPGKNITTKGYAIKKAIQIAAEEIASGKVVMDRKED